MHIIITVIFTAQHGELQSRRVKSIRRFYGIAIYNNNNSISASLSLSLSYRMLRIIYACVTWSEHVVLHTHTHNRVHLLTDNASRFPERTVHSYQTISGQCQYIHTHKRIQTHACALAERHTPICNIQFIFFSAFCRSSACSPLTLSHCLRLFDVFVS